MADLRSRSSVSMSSMKEAVETVDDPASVNSAEHVRQSRSSVLSRWEQLRQVAEERRATLEASRRLQVFKRDERQALAWIEDKLQFAADDSYREPSNLQAKQQKQQAFEAELAARQEAHDVLIRMGQELIDSDHYAKAQVEKAVDGLSQAWQELLDQAAERARKLEEAMQLADALRQFQTRVHDLMSWMKHISEEMSSVELAKDIPSAEATLETHQEQKGEIDTRQSTFEDVVAFGEDLVRSGHYAAAEVQQTLETLCAEHEKVVEIWQEHQHHHHQCYELHLFERDAQASDTWTSTREMFLTSCEDDLGDSLDHVEALLKKHGDFETSLATQEEKEIALNEYAQRLVQEAHYDGQKILQRCEQVLDRRQALKERSAARRKLLEESLQLQRFERDVVEAEAWCNEKAQIANDESYRDPTNLQSKVQKQQAFDAEILANRSQIDAVSATAMMLNDAGHYASERVTQRVEELSELWEALCAASKLKAQRLEEAVREQQLLRDIDDVEAWMEAVEAALGSEEQGKDLASVHALLKRHGLTEANIAAYRERVEGLHSQGEALVDAGHFDREAIAQRCEALVARYGELSEPAQTRRELLEASLRLQELLRDIRDVEVWLAEREPRGFSTDYGTDLTSVQSLQKQHTAFLLELTSHEPQIAGVGDIAQELVDSHHFATDTIIEKWEMLQQTWEQLKEASETRTDKLEQALQAQSYYTDATDSETWMELKRVFVAGGGLGKDEDTTEQLLKGVAATETALDMHQQDTLAQLQSEVDVMVARNNFDVAGVETRQAQLVEQCSQLQVLLKTRQRDLNFSIELHRFMRQAATEEQWLAEKAVIAGSDDLGRDVEHVQHLRERFETFAQSMLPVGSDRIQAVLEMGNRLLNADQESSSLVDPSSVHPIVEASPTITTRQKTLQESWLQLQEAVAERQAQLAAAERIHAFSRDVAEARSWISEKDAQLTDDYGKDVGSAQNLQRQQEAFERDLEAVQTRVEELTVSADRLAEQFPASATSIDEQRQLMLESWQELQARTAARRERLSDSLELYHFLSDVVGLISWMEDMMNILSTSDSAIHDVASAEAALQLHDDHRRAIDSREDTVVKVTEFGQGLVDRGHFACEQVQERLEQVHSSWDEIHQIWQERKQLLDWALEAQQFDREAERIEAWLAFHEPQVEINDLNDDTAAVNVEELIKKHSALEKMLAGQEERLRNLDDHAERLVTGDANPPATEA